jgi:phosphoesterase RecJ-like protein
MTIPWRRFHEIVAAHQRFLLTSHVRPDCDALGSELVMHDILATLGKDVRIVNGQATPAILSFIDPNRLIQALGDDVAPEALDDRQVLIVLDTSAWAQLGPMAEVVRRSKAVKAVIDHHVSGDDLGAEQFKNTSAEATGRLVVEAADALGVPLTPVMASAAFAALATDTGWFRFNSTSVETMRLAGRLIDAGAHPQSIYTALYEQDTLARVKLRGRILARCVAELNGRLVHTAALREDFETTGALPFDTEDVINLTLAVAGTQVAAIFVEVAPRKFKISLRSRGAIDCSSVAEQFSGGGHKAAAGATLEGSFEDVRAKVLDAVRLAMAQSAAG